MTEVLMTEALMTEVLMTQEWGCWDQPIRR
jgi:hypothetical protein